MHIVRNGGAELAWEAVGDVGLPALVLLNSIGTDMSLWDGALPHLAPGFRVLRMDARGHGRSGAPAGDYDLGMLADDVAVVMNAADVRTAAVAGVSLGGMIAMELALRHPSRVSALVLICTSVTMDRKAWSDRVAMVRDGGMASVADAAMGRFLSGEFAAANPAAAAAIRSGLVSMSPQGYAGAAAAIRDMDLAGRVRDVRRPALIVAGDLDVSTPFAGHGDYLASAIPAAQVEYLRCGHLAPVEAPLELASTIREFLEGAA